MTSSFALAADSNPVWPGDYTTAATIFSNPEKYPDALWIISGEYAVQIKRDLATESSEWGGIVLNWYRSDQNGKIELKPIASTFYSLKEYPEEHGNGPIERVRFQAEYDRGDIPAGANRDLWYRIELDLFRLPSYGEAYNPRQSQFSVETTNDAGKRIIVSSFPQVFNSRTVIEEWNRYFLDQAAELNSARDCASKLGTLLPTIPPKKP